MRISLSDKSVKLPETSSFKEWVYNNIIINELTLG